MKFRFGKVPENEKFLPQLHGWSPIKEPSPWIMQLMAFPIGVAISYGLALLWVNIDIGWHFGIGYHSVIFLLIGIVIIHEMIHALLHPGLGISTNTIIGFWPAKMLFYAHYDNVLSRKRFITILIGSFLILSLFPLLGALILGGTTIHVAFVSVFNALISCGDVFGAFLMMIMVPKRAMVRNKGWETYYRMIEQENLADR